MSFSAVESGWTSFAHVWKEETSAVCCGDVSEFPTHGDRGRPRRRLKIAVGAQVVSKTKGSLGG